MTIQKRSGSYDAGRKGYSRELVRLILDWNPELRRNRLLDLGTGTGIFLAPLARHFRDALGTDLSEDRIRQARETHPKLRFAIGSGDKIDVNDRSVDLVTAAQSFMYFDRAKSLAEIRRVLKPRGTVALVWKYPVISSAPILAINRAIEGLPGPIRAIPDGSDSVRALNLLADLGRAGFRRIAYEELPVSLEFSRDDIHALGIHSTGFATAEIDALVEAAFHEALDRNLGRGRKWKVGYLEHAFLATGP